MAYINLSNLEGQLQHEEAALDYARKLARVLRSNPESQHRLARRRHPASGQ